VTGREQQISVNEILFREVNERIEDVSERRSTLESVDFVCECGRPDCTSRVPLTYEQYEAVRSDGQRFMVLPGHLTGSIERVVEDHGTYQVVEKDDGEAAELAEATNPR
jgi:hypothetical protein